VDGFRFAISCDVFGFRAGSLERTSAVGAAVVVRPELQKNKVPFLDLRLQILPEETIVKAAAARAAEGAVDDVNFSRSKNATIGAPQPHCCMFEPSPKVPLRTVESPMIHKVGNFGFAGVGGKYLPLPGAPSSAGGLPI
jgi:hypothetical protein